MGNRKTQERMKQSADRKRDSSEPDICPPENSVESEDWIGRQLREVYDKTLSEPIPDRFLELLKKIDKKDSESK